MAVKKQDARSLSSEAQEAIRCRAVQAVLEGMTQTEAARNFGIARGTVSKWMKQYRTGGNRALKALKQGRPRESGRLKGWQAAMIVRTITDKTPDQVKMPFMLWTPEAVRTLIALKTKVQLSLSTVGRLLRRWGFTPRKPVRRAWEQDTNQLVLMVTLKPCKSFN